MSAHAPDRRNIAGPSAVKHAHLGDPSDGGGFAGLYNQSLFERIGGCFTDPQDLLPSLELTPCGERHEVLS